MLEVGHGHRVYWETSGNPRGIPALYLHGGPGSGFSDESRRFFDPDLYYAVCFDQRGCGRSTPLASDPNIDLSSNTTHHLIDDIERLREHLEIEKWKLLGLSWGTTLGLAYAQRHPARVTGMVLGFVTTTTRREVDWVTEGVARLFPEEWERFAGAVPESLRHLRLVDAYAEMLSDDDPSVREAAAMEWCRWEDAHVSIAPGSSPDPRFQDPNFRLGFARLVTHYWRNAAFLEDREIERNIDALDGIPAMLLHGRFDVSCPIEVAWNLTQRWSTASLQILDDAGHGGGSTTEALPRALASVSG